jgi:transposase-like protein
MDPQPSFCPNLDCPSRGKIGDGNLRVHDRKRNRWKCRTCGKTFSARQGTPFVGLKHPIQLVVWVITLLAYGCPRQAIVAAFGLDERTVADWQQRAGLHCQRVHTDQIQQPRPRQRVQVDERRVRGHSRRVLWMGMALCATSRLWLGGIVSLSGSLAGSPLAHLVHSCCAWGPLLVVTDGWGAYADAFLKAFRRPHVTGRRGRPALIPWPDFVLAQTVKWQQARRCLGIRVCHLHGHWRAIAGLLPQGQVLSTAYIERLNATFRQRLAPLCRRSRCLVGSPAGLEAGMYLVGSVYNFCTPHCSLSQPGRPVPPAMAAGVTSAIWNVPQLLCYQVPPPPYVPPKRRGRPPKLAACHSSEGGKTNVTV